MRQLVYFVAISADGCIAGPAGQVDFYPMRGDHIDAQVAELPETLPRHVRAALGVPTRQARFDTVLMGSRTYAPGLAAGITDPYAPLETIVFSRQQAPRRDGSLRVTNEEPLNVVRELKAEPGRDLWLCGGGNLAATLLGEIDELIVKVNPVLAIDGIRLFEGLFNPRELELSNRRAFASGVTWLTFRLKQP